MYLTYNEYQGYGGELDATEFEALEYAARMKIDEQTLGRLKDLPEQVEEVKRCIYKFIKIGKNDTNIKQETVDGYSVTYTGDYSAQVSNTIEEYLSECQLDDGTPYLYRGVQMTTNSAMTHYTKVNSKWVKTIYKDVLWQEGDGSLFKDGMLEKNITWMGSNLSHP